MVQSFADEDLPVATKYKRDASPSNPNETAWQASRTRAWLENEQPGTPGANKLLWLVLPLILLFYFGGRYVNAPAPQTVAPEYGPGVVTGVAPIANGMIALDIELQTPLGETVSARVATKEAGWQPGQPIEAAYRMDDTRKSAEVTALFRPKADGAASASP